MAEDSSGTEPQSRTLAVASAGGHLQQLIMLLPRLSAGALSWVTYDVPQTEALLAGQQVFHAHYPTTKHLPNAARNYSLARRILRHHAVERVISTGAAVAVPFIVEARRNGIPCHYIESATRLTGPSLSGRLLERVPGVHRYWQSGAWERRGWAPGPSVFDGFEVEEESASSTAAGDPGIRRAVVSLGTHRFPYPELVRRVRQLLPAEETDVYWQLGGTPDTWGLPGRVVTQTTSDVLDAEIRDADVLVGHAGVGLALTALSLGKVPVMVPRRRARREHTDDHQAELARELGRRGLAVTAEVGKLTREHLERAATLVATKREASPFNLRD